MPNEKDRPTPNTPGADEHEAEAPPASALPDPGTVVSEHTLRSPGGRTYRVLRTGQRDEYDEDETTAGEGDDDVPLPDRQSGGTSGQVRPADSDARDGPDSRDPAD